jgi:aryl-alcohol dehydrogenase-like predicted oxidoreductase
MVPTLHRFHKQVNWSRLPVSPLILGLDRICSYGPNVNSRSATRLIETAIGLGVNIFDTADIYGQGDSEKLLGAIVRKSRNEVIICTKVGYRLSSSVRFLGRIKPILKPIFALATAKSKILQTSMTSAREARRWQDFSAKYLTSAIDGCLSRLRTDYIDLLFLHSPPMGDFRVDEVQSVLERAKHAGKILAYGISCQAPSDAEVCLRWPHIAAVQVRLDETDRTNGLSALQKNVRKVSIIARQILSGSDALSNMQGSIPKWASEAGAAPIRHRAKIRTALCVPLRSGLVDFVLVGTTNVDHLREDTAAVAEILSA